MTETPEPVYYWLVCKICHKLHSADVIPSNPEQLMSKSRKVACPNILANMLNTVFQIGGRAPSKMLVSFLADVDVCCYLKLQYSILI